MTPRKFASVRERRGGGRDDVETMEAGAELKGEGVMVSGEEGSEDCRGRARSDRACL